MASKNKAVEEVEKLLRDIGIKIDELIEKGKEASGEAKKEIEKKIEELKLNKEDLERDFQNKKTKFEQLYNRKKTEMDPRFKKSGIHLREAFKQLNEAVKALFSK
jgi:Skp family chaperone for outer membrane proteins